MASLYEIIDPSNLKYDTQLGFTHTDSGFGPATSVPGWIRTGSQANPFIIPGVGNCNAWTSPSGADSGTSVFLSAVWTTLEVTQISPWVAARDTCDNPRPVWCVQD